MSPIFQVFKGNNNIFLTSYDSCSLTWKICINMSIDRDIRICIENMRIILYVDSIWKRNSLQASKNIYNDSYLAWKKRLFSCICILFVILMWVFLTMLIHFHLFIYRVSRELDVDEEVNMWLRLYIIFF